MKGVDNCFQQSWSPMRSILLLLALLLSHARSYTQEAQFRLASLFTDNMVVQQKSKVTVWGKGSPGSTITLRASWGEKIATRVGPDRAWSMAVRTPGAGGPYQIDIHHDDTTLTLRNVLAGEVWLCSGQSNMEMPLEGWPPDTILNSGDEIRHSAYPEIRLFNVKRTYSPTPEAVCLGRWEECSPAASARFSATAYFFGKELHRNLKVPIGLIHSSWGGTPVQAWTSGEFLSRVAGFDSTIQSIRLAVGDMKTVHAWLSQFPAVDMSARPREAKWQNLGLEDNDCMSPQLNDTLWRPMQLPTVWEKTEMGEFDGVVWFRKDVRIPPAWVHRDLVVELGPIDDMDITYINGTRVGSHETENQWNVDRNYKISKELIDSTLIHIAVRVIDYGGGGGIYGQAKSMSIHPADLEERVSLAGEWKYLPVADYRADKLYVLGSKGEQFFKRPHLSVNFSAYAATALYNGMIAPLVPFALAGVIWYQGEANTDAPVLYKTLFPLMIENWRKNFRESLLPFYFVQIAPYSYGDQTGSQYLREAQLSALAMKNTGMAVTMDIGNPRNIHPSNKQDVGRRLALWALAKNYKKDVEYSGPLYRARKKFKDSIELMFDHAQSGLVLIGREEGNGFQIAGQDRVFRQAEVRVVGSRLVVSHPDITNPEAVRYAFRNTAQATLFNVAGLPSPSFRTDDWALHGGTSR